jgi:hypothetical protein
LKYQNFIQYNLNVNNKKIQTTTTTTKYLMNERNTLLRNVPTIPNDQTSDFLLYFLLEIDSGAIQQTGPISALVLSNQTQKSQTKENETFHSLLSMRQCCCFTNKRNLSCLLKS